MKPDWDKLAEEYKDSSSVLIADVDCTASGKSLCEKNGVQGYPTIKTFPKGDLEGEKYEQGRDLESLRKHAASLGPVCSVDSKDLCSEEQWKALEKYIAMSKARRDGRLNKLKNAIKKAEDAHDELRKQLSAKFEESNSALEKLRDELKPQIKLMTMATPQNL